MTWLLQSWHWKVLRGGRHTCQPALCQMFSVGKFLGILHWLACSYQTAVCPCCHQQDSASLPSSADLQAS